MSPVTVVENMVGNLASFNTWLSNVRVSFRNAKVPCPIAPMLGWLALDTRVEVELSSKGEKKKIKVTE